MDLSRFIIRLIKRGYVKFSSGIHMASSRGYPVQVTRNSLMVFLPFCTLRHRNIFSTSYTGSFTGSMSAGCRSTGLLHIDVHQGFKRDTWKIGCMDHFSGRLNSYAARLSFLLIWNGPTKRRCNFRGQLRNHMYRVLSSTC